jgi:hypothetical protein
MPKLSYVNTTLSFALKAIALPALERITGELIIADSPNLASLDLPLLASVGRGIEITNVTILSTLNLPCLTNLSSSSTITGSFNQLLLPDLHHVGNLSINTTGKFNCSAGAQAPGVLQGFYNCSSADFSLFAAGGTPNTTTATSASSGGGGLSTSTKAGIGAGVWVGAAILIIAGAVLLFFQRRRAKARRAAAQNKSSTEQIKPELSTESEIPRKELEESKAQGRAELEGPMETRSAKSEMDGSSQKPEPSAQNVSHELP